MSYITSIFMQRSIAKAADALEIVEACKTHKLQAADAGKFRLLADEMKRAATRFNDLATQQSVMTTDDFFKKALEYAAVLKRERAILVRAQREKREQHERERAELLADMAQMQAAA